MRALEDEFRGKGGFKAGGFVSTAQVGPLIKRFSEDANLADKISDIMKIEQNVRNLAAHDIVSVTSEWIYERIQFTPEQIFRIIQYLTAQAGIRAKDAYWESYDKMNQIIQKELKM